MKPITRKKVTYAGNQHKMRSEGANANWEWRLKAEGQRRRRVQVSEDVVFGNTWNRCFTGQGNPNCLKNNRVNGSLAY